MKIVCIDHPFRHHGEHSGYKMLGRFLGTDIMENPQKVSRLFDWLPIQSFLQLHPNWYSKEALLVEWEISKHILLGSGNIYHFLYGENSFRRTGKVNRLSGKKNAIVATYHQIPKFFEERRKQFLNLVDLDAVVVVSTIQRPFLESIVDATKVHFIPHGVDVDFFRPADETTKPKKQFRCLTVGSNYRDFDLHLETIKKLNNTALAGNIEFQIIGEARFASTFSEIDNVFYRSGVSDEKLLSAYQEADVLLMPLQDTTANNAVLEAMACGLPIVVSDVGGIRDYVDESLAVIVPPHNLDAIVSAVSCLFLNYDQRISMGSLARGKAKDSFGWEVIARQVEEMYKTLFRK